MTPQDRPSDHGSAPESKFYLPATPSFLTSRAERIWATLFSHGVETPK